MGLFFSRILRGAAEIERRGCLKSRWGASGMRACSWLACMPGTIDHTLQSPRLTYTQDVRVGGT